MRDYADVTFDGPSLTIGASHTGDMYDVAQARNILGDARVLIWGVNDSSVSKAAEIARFVGDSHWVMAAGQPAPPGGPFARAAVLRDLVRGTAARGRRWITEGGATTIVVEDANRHDGDIDVGNIAPEVRVRDTTASLDPAMVEDLEAHGFRRGVRYGIVNFRQSGHSGVGNAPALDTGVQGFEQLLQTVRDQGLVPVPMGERPAQPQRHGPEEEADLVEYWRWPSIAGRGRRAEVRLLRVIMKNFDIGLAVGMRSGVTDLLRYVGIGTLTIDIHPERGDAAKEWQRTLKRQRRYDPERDRSYGIRSYALVSLPDVSRVLAGRGNATE